MPPTLPLLRNFEKFMFLGLNLVAILSKSICECLRKFNAGSMNATELGLYRLLLKEFQKLTF